MYQLNLFVSLLVLSICLTVTCVTETETEGGSSGGGTNPVDLLKGRTVQDLKSIFGQDVRGIKLDEFVTELKWCADNEAEERHLQPTLDKYKVTMQRFKELLGQN